MDFYRQALRPLFFSALKLDPELAHQQGLKFLHWLDRNQDRQPAAALLQQCDRSFGFRDRRLAQTLWGLNFPNPLGLAAGFDKDGKAAGIWGRLGMGFAELGTVTYHPQPGNPRPRLFRLPNDRAALNRMGFNNLGSVALAERLQEVTAREIPLGINLGKSKITPLATAAADYVGSFQRLQDLGDYFVANVSSPNTPGLRSLQDKNQLAEILAALQAENRTQKPIFVKIAPDLEWGAIADVIDLAFTYQLAGIIATNTTIRRQGLRTKVIVATGKPIAEEAGGISGRPLRDRATEIIRFIHQQTQGKLAIIGVGGIFNSEDAWAKITAGASLIQVYTGWVYEGPAMVPQLLDGLCHKLEQHGLNSISDAIGNS